MSKQMTTFKTEMFKMKTEIEKVLPDNVSYEKFERLTFTAVANNSRLLAADRGKLFSALLKCASWGIYPDNNEAYFVIFKGDPVIVPSRKGIVRKMWEGGMMESFTVEIVRKGDDFRMWTDDLGQHINHETCATEGKIIGVYAMVGTKKHGRIIEYMTKEEVDKCKAASPAGNKGPWGSWWEEMAKKSVIKRLAKSIPWWTDTLNDMVETDNQAVETVAKVENIADYLGNLGDPEQIAHDIKEQVSDKSQEKFPTENKEIPPETQKEKKSTAEQAAKKDNFVDEFLEGNPW